ncbi:Putative F-box protein At4g38870 [Linum perenne]
MFMLRSQRRFTRYVTGDEFIKKELMRVYDQRVDEWVESNNNDDAVADEILNKEEEMRKTISVIDHCLIADDDLLVFQILTRLPVKSLMRFKCVCKAWKSIIEKDEHFINLHHTHSQSRPGFFIMVAPANPVCNEGGYDVSLLSADLNLNVHSVKRMIQSSWSVICVGPVRGLLCLAGNYGVQICNVSTGEVTPWIKSDAAEKELRYCNYFPCQVDFTTRSMKYVFGFDHGSGKHKVMSFWWNDEKMVLHCEVLTVGVDSSWRRIDAVPPFNPHIVENMSACYADGSIYWLRRKTRNSRIGCKYVDYSESLMAFDLGSEKFRLIPIPEFTHFEDTESEYGSFKYSSYIDRLVEMDGCLTVILRRNRTVKMWRFHDYNKEETSVGSEKEDWTEMEDIKLPSEITCDVFLYFHTISGKGQLILEAHLSSPLHNSAGCIPFERNPKFARFYSYDLKLKTLSRLRTDGVVPFVPQDYLTTCAPLVESLFPVGKKLQQD